MAKNKTEGERDMFIKSIVEEFNFHHDASRGTNDLSPLEEWLIVQLYYETKVVSNLINNEEDINSSCSCNCGGSCSPKSNGSG